MKRMLFVLMLSCLASTLALNTVLAQQVTDGRFQCYVTAPVEAQANQEFSIAFDVYPMIDINASRIFVEVYGNIAPDGKWSSWNYTWTDMTMHGQTDYIANNTYFVNTTYFSAEYGYAGTLYGEIQASYSFNGENYFVYSNFAIGNIYPAVTYGDLRQNYNSLNQSYASMNETYLSQNNSLKSSLNFYQGIALTLMVTTIVFALATVILVARRRKDNVSSDRILSPQSLISNTPSFCRYCGTQNTSDAVFCTKCGKKLT